MSLHRFFVSGSLPDDDTRGWVASLSERDLRHVTLVLRMQPGDGIVLADACGREAECVIDRVAPDAVTVDVRTVAARQAGPRVALAQGLARRERMELAIQRTTELGVTEILPVAFSRSIVRMDEVRAGKRTERWRRIAEEAAKQSQRADVPVIRDIVDLAGLVEAAAGFDIVLVPWEESVGSEVRVPGVGEALESAGADIGATVLVIIGPEGGLEATEVSTLCREAGAIPVNLGETILRTETAAIVAVALASYELGGLGGRPRA